MPRNMQGMRAGMIWYDDIERSPGPLPVRIDWGRFEAAALFTAPDFLPPAAKERNSKMRFILQLEIPERFFEANSLATMKPAALLQVHALMTIMREAGAKGKLLTASEDNAVAAAYFTADTKGMEKAFETLDPAFVAASKAVKEAACA